VWEGLCWFHFDDTECDSCKSCDGGAGGGCRQFSDWNRGCLSSFVNATHLKAATLNRIRTICAPPLLRVIGEHSSGWVQPDVLKDAA
jgi:hypothetical protein